MTLHLIIKENTESKTEELVSSQEIIFVIFKQREWLWNFSHDHCKTNTITNGKLRSSYRDRERGWQHRTTFTLLTYYFQCSRLPHDKSVYAKWLIRAGVYPGFCGTRRLGVFFTPPWMGCSPSQGYPQHFAVPIYTPGWREALWENTTLCSRPGPEPGPLDPESSTLTMRPPRLPHDTSCQQSEWHNDI